MKLKMGAIICEKSGIRPQFENYTRYPWVDDKEQKISSVFNLVYYQNPPDKVLYYAYLLVHCINFLNFIYLFIFNYYP